MNKEIEKKTFLEKSQSEEWLAWKFVSDMLDSPDEIGIYPTSDCYEQIHDFVVEQKEKAKKQERERIIEEIEKMEIEEVGNSANTANQIIDIIKKIK